MNGCHTPHKRAFGDRATAVGFVERLRDSRRGRLQPLDVYRCSSCGFWHTSRPRGARKRRANARKTVAAAALVVALLALALPGCATIAAEARAVPARWATFTGPQTGTLAAGVACVGADVGTTLVGRKRGLDEANAMLRSIPIMLAVKVALLVIAWELAEQTGQRVATWSGVAVANCGVAGWNAYQIDRYGEGR